VLSGGPSSPSSWAQAHFSYRKNVKKANGKIIFFSQN
jgi:hypothetical protein